MTNEKWLPVSPALDFLRHLWELNHGMERVSKRMEATLGLTAQQRLIVRFLGRYPGLTSSALAHNLHLDPATISVSLARLVKKRLVSRTRSRADGRVVHLSLTAQGLRLDRPFEGSVENALEQLLRHTPPSEVEVVKRVLEELTARLFAQVDEPPAKKLPKARSRA